MSDGVPAEGSLEAARTEAMYAFIVAQDGKCVICHEALKLGQGSKGAHLDHCHSSGLLRGMLCCSCNTKLGWYEKHAQAIGSYLRQARRVVHGGARGHNLPCVTHAVKMLAGVVS